MTTRSPSRDFSLAAGALWLSATAFLTLHPVGWIQDISFWSVWVQSMAGVDMVQNILLFAPMGWIANRGRWSVWRTVLTSVLVSGGIEFAQQWVPGRASMATDIVFNTVGAALGWWMATSATRPRVRVVLQFAALACLLGVHALNTEWPASVAHVDGTGAWEGVTLTPCGAGALPSTVCLVIPNGPIPGEKMILATGESGHTYARVQDEPWDQAIGGDDCVTMRFESTVGARLAFRPPLTLACGLADSTGGSFELRLNPRLEHTARGAWEPTQIGVWMWPVWPFETYHRDLLRAVGALAFVIGTALLAETAPLWIPAGYLLMLTLAAVVTGMRGPGLWVIAWTGIAWLVAMAVVKLDAWWRQES